MCLTFLFGDSDGETFEGKIAGVAFPVIAFETIRSRRQFVIQGTVLSQTVSAF